MVYVGQDGRLQESRPFGVSYVVDLFWGFIGFFIFFFRSLFHMDDPSPRGQYGNGNRNTNSRAFPQAWPRRRMGGFSSGSAPAPPPCAPGGG